MRSDRHRHLLLVVAVAWVAGRASASNPSSAEYLPAATEREAFAAIPAGARAVGMGEAFTAVADDAGAVWWNPGGLPTLHTLSAMGMYAVMGEGMGLGQVAIAMPLGTVTAGLGLTTFRFGSYNVTDEFGNVTDTVSPTDIAVSVGLGTSVGSVLPGASIGASVQAIHEEGLRTDAGLTVGGAYLLGRATSLGLVLQGLGLSRKDSGPPAIGRIGIARRIDSGVAAVVSGDLGYGFTSQQVTLAVGGEVLLGRLLALRTGYRWRANEVRMGGVTGITAGVGAVVSGFGIDYGYQPFGKVANQHRVALSYRQQPSPATATVAALPSVRVPQEEPKVTTSVPTVALAPAAAPAIEPAAAAMPDFDAPSQTAPIAVPAKVPQAKVGVAVMDLQARGVPASDAAIIADLLRAELGKAGLQVVEKANMDKVLADHAIAQAGCASEDCAAKAGNLLNIQRVVVGSFGMLADKYVVSLRLVDVQSGGIVFASSVSGQEVEEIQSGVRELAVKIAKQAR